MPRETFYDEIEIEDFTWDPLANVFHYPCPCGDRFEITKSQLRDGDEVARCPSCSLLVRVIYEWVSGGQGKERMRTANLERRNGRTTLRTMIRPKRKRLVNFDGRQPESRPARSPPRPRQSSRPWTTRR